MLSSYKVILLDMNSTFMFGEDRFGEDQDYSATYASLGGADLNAEEIIDIIQKTYDLMSRLYESPAHYDDFPQVIEVMKSIAQVSDLELSLLAQTFAYHELGYIPNEYENMVRELARHYELGLVANIWSAKHYWLTTLEKANLLMCFKSMVFSSDSRSIKPSANLFQQACVPFNVQKSEVVYIGDSWRCDIEGAYNFGIEAIWINKEGKQCNAFSAAKHVIPNLIRLFDYTIKEDQ